MYMTDLGERVALGRLLHMSSHSSPADPVLFAQRQRISSVGSQSAAGI